jgi:hypothetical protein
MSMLDCRYCNKQCKNPNSLRNHERLCKSNPNRQDLANNFIEYNKKIKSGEIKKTYTNQYVKAKELGLDPPKISEETRLKMSLSSKGRKWSKEKRESHSKIMKRVVELNSDSYTTKNVVGRVKNINYNGVILKGSWELEVAKWLDKNNIKWTNKITPFKYFWNGSDHLYYPDFYLLDKNIYIEVKGYERERDRAKWKVVDNLIVIKQKEIEEIKIGAYRLSLITS